MTKKQVQDDEETNFIYAPRHAEVFRHLLSLA